jgi:hypothetical protein
MQKIGAFGAGAALTIAAIAGAATVIDRAGSATTQAPADSTRATVISAIDITSENAVWERVPMPIAGDNGMTLAHDGTSFYLLGTDNRGRAMIMQSSTGVDWTAIPGPAGGQNMWFQQLVATPEVLVAIGAGFDERRGQDSAMVFLSEDRDTWRVIELTADDTIEVAGRTVNLHTWVDSVDISESGFTIIGNQGADIDPEELLRDVVDPELLRHGYGQDNNGMQFYDDHGNLVEAMTWEELDLAPELVSLISGSRSIMWTSPDGIEWQASSGSQPPGTNGIGALALTGNVTAAMAWGEFGPSLWLDDGEEWKRPEVEFLATALTSWGDQLVVAGTAKTDGRSGVWTSRDGTTWAESSVPAGVINQFFTSADGIVGIGYGQDAGIATLGPAEIQVDDLTVLASSDGRFQVVDSDGNTVVDVFEENVTRAERITITHPDTGEVVVEFDNLAYERAWEAIYRESDFARGPGRPEISIFLSQDAANWVVVPMEDPTFHPNSVALGDDSILLIGWSEDRGILGFGGERQQMYLVHGS